MTLRNPTSFMKRTASGATKVSAIFASICKILVRLRAPQKKPHAVPSHDAQTNTTLCFIYGSVPLDLYNTIRGRTRHYTLTANGSCCYKMVHQLVCLHSLYSHINLTATIYTSSGWVRTPSKTYLFFLNHIPRAKTANNSRFSLLKC
jgi:hypothetical protein